MERMGERKGKYELGRNDIKTNGFFPIRHGMLSRYGCAKFNIFRKFETNLDSIQSIETPNLRLIN